MSVGYHVRRALAYALTSLASLYAGALSQPAPADPVDYWFLAALWLGSLYFFVAYASSSDRRRDGQTYLAVIPEREALSFAAIIAAFSLLAVSGWHEFANPASTWRLGAIFVVYSLLFVVYGRHLIKHYADAARPPARHQVAWPTLLSIGAAYFVGSSLPALHQDLTVLWPLLFLFIYCICLESLFLRFSGQWPKRVLVIGSAALSVLLGLFVVCARLGLVAVDPVVSNGSALLLLSISVAAYLATFESWRVTSRLTQREEELAGTVRTDDIPLTLGGEYHLSTLLAQMVTLTVLPFVYIFSTLGLVFLWVLTLHGLVAFLYWLTRSREHLLMPNWPRFKTAFGAIALAILVFDSSLGPVDFSVASSLVTFEVVEFLVLLGIAGSVIKPLAAQLLRAKRKSSKPGELILRLFEKRVNALRVFSLMSCGAMFAAFLLHWSTTDLSVDTSQRSAQAFFVYVVYFGVSSFGSLLSKFYVLPKWKP